MIQRTEETTDELIHAQRDREAGEQRRDDALVAITAALVACQRAKFSGPVLDRLLEAKALALKERE